MTAPEDLNLPLRVETDVRIAFPKAGLQMDHKGSRKSAIDTNCKICVGYDAGYRAEIRDCTSLLCPFWTMRPYATKEQRTRPEGMVPTEEQYTEMHEASISDAQRAAGAALSARKDEIDDEGQARIDQVFLALGDALLSGKLFDDEDEDDGDPLEDL